ncbi:MAG: hypothetical protein ACE5H4_11445 [Candidatus Thorarchaeota archaeon]
MPRFGSARIKEKVDIGPDKRVVTLASYLNASFGVVSMALVFVPIAMIPGYVIIALFAEIYLADWVYTQLSGKAAQVTVDVHVRQQDLDTLSEIHAERTAIASVVNREFAR